ncbi:MAG: cytochrome C [Desulfobulbaceae bacterium S3730MH12]|nr:MAG: cytochrome C [Desulfobulbaceae bacterium S5133MH15]OEU57128.1 MAG: cytochrome C [Desulfobulbaceae bacterium S3730MH12]OEU82351.1 MAG: cytochrome C [Desulfobulbaceae bacterium C00003063]
MKNGLTIAFACIAVCMLAPFSAFGAGGPKPELRPKATTIAELAERYDSSGCVECHEDAHDEWSESLHAVSILGTPRTAPTIITAIEKGLKLFPYSGVKEDSDITVESLMMCMKCHLPQLDEATDDVAREIVATIRSWQQAYRDSDDEKAEALEETIASLNIGCMVCHNKMAIIHKYADGYPQPDTVYGSQEGDHEDEVYPKMAVAPALGESIFCGQCHGQGPNFELDHPSQCATAYGSYLFAYVAHGGNESCQECHMHKSELGHNMASYRDETMIEMALDVSVEGRSLFWRKDKGEGVLPIGVINVEIYNKTGHGIPDG